MILQKTSQLTDFQRNRLSASCWATCEKKGTRHERKVNTLTKETKNNKSRVRKAEFVKLTKLIKKFDDIRWCWSVMFKKEPNMSNVKTISWLRKCESSRPKLLWKLFKRGPHITTWSVANEGKKKKKYWMSLCETGLFKRIPHVSPKMLGEVGLDVDPYEWRLTA